MPVSAWLVEPAFAVTAVAQAVIPGRSACARSSGILTG